VLVLNFKIIVTGCRQIFVQDGYIERCTDYDIGDANDDVTGDVCVSSAVTRWRQHDVTDAKWWRWWWRCYSETGAWMGKEATVLRCWPVAVSSVLEPSHLVRVSDHLTTWPAGQLLSPEDDGSVTVSKRRGWGKRDAADDCIYWQSLLRFIKVSAFLNYCRFVHLVSAAVVHRRGLWPVRGSIHEKPILVSLMLFKQFLKLLLFGADQTGFNPSSEKQCLLNSSHPCIAVSP